MTDDAASVRVFRADDEPRVLELLQIAFGQWPRDVAGVPAAEFFRWKHMLSPFGPSILLVAELDGAIVGFLALLTWCMRVGARSITTIRGTDLVVDPAVRRRGASMALITASRDHFPPGVTFGWNNPNQYSRGGVLKSGRHKVNGVPRFVTLGRAPLASVRRAVGGEPKAPGALPVRAQTAGEVLGDSAGISQLMALVGEPEDAYVTAKDLAYLRWRYGRFDEYRAFTAELDGRCGGLVIFRLRRHGRFLVAQVCELLVAAGQRAIARRLLGKVKRSAAADIVACAFPSRGEAARLGFVDSLSGASLTANPLREGIVPDPTMARSWALSLGDLELL